VRGHVRKRCPKPAAGLPPCASNCGHSWAYVVEVAANDGGRRKQVWRSGFRTKREASAALAHALVEAEGPTASTLRVEQYLREWLEHLHRKPATLATYRRMLDQRLVPAVGDVLLAQLTGETLRNAYASWLAVVSFCRSLYGRLGRNGYKLPRHGLEPFYGQIRHPP